MRKRTITSLLVILSAVTCMASADITLEVVPVDGTVSGKPVLNGYVTQDLVVTTDTDWMSAQMIVTLDEPDQIYQYAGITSPQSWNPNVGNPFSLIPFMGLDTYVNNGVLGESVSVLAAVDMGETEVIFNDDKLALVWFTAAMDDIGTLALARITLADTANGTWQFVATAAPQGGPSVEVLDGIVVDGVMYIPEPATLSLLTLASLALMRRKRK